MKERTLEHGRFSYSAIVDRPPLRWPNGARVAVWVAPNVEHFRFDAPVPGGRGGVPDVPAYASRDYGNRVGVWRIMDVLDRLGVRASVMLNAEVCDQEPRIIEEGIKRGWEWLGHGLTNTTLLAGMSEEEEERTILECARRIEQATGTRPRGWLGPGLHQTNRTLDLLAKLGFDYVADWVNDDQPYLMHTDRGSLVSIPYTLELNDKRMFERLGLPGPEFTRCITDQFDTLYREGEVSGRVMAIALHPYLTGVPYRIKYLEEALTYIGRHDQVWWATAGEIVDTYREQVPQPERNAR